MKIIASENPMTGVERQGRADHGEDAEDHLEHQLGLHAVAEEITVAFIP
jgi:hypothetical protein